MLLFGKKWNWSVTNKQVNDNCAEGLDLGFSLWSVVALWLRVSWRSQRTTRPYNLLFFFNNIYIKKEFVLFSFK